MAKNGALSSAMPKVEPPRANGGMAMGITKMSLFLSRLTTRRILRSWHVPCLPLNTAFFARDLMSVIGNGLRLSRMYGKDRNREEALLETIAQYHPNFWRLSIYGRRRKVLIGGRARRLT